MHIVTTGRGDEIVAALKARVDKSRFTAAIWARNEKGRVRIQIRFVRLRRKKDYCGQHPGPCLFNPFFEKKHRVTHNLEGADWVGWDDMVNDVLDGLGVDALFYSQSMEFKGKLVMRKGTRRRVRYYAVSADNEYFPDAVRWDTSNPDSSYEDWCGREAPRSDYEDSTPGIADWRPEAEEDHAHAH